MRYSPFNADGTSKNLEMCTLFAINDNRWLVSNGVQSERPVVLLSHFRIHNADTDASQLMSIYVRNPVSSTVFAFIYFKMSILRVAWNCPASNV